MSHLYYLILNNHDFFIFLASNKLFFDLISFSFSWSQFIHHHSFVEFYLFFFFYSYFPVSLLHQIFHPRLLLLAWSFFFSFFLLHNAQLHLFLDFLIIFPHHFYQLIHLNFLINSLLTILNPQYLPQVSFLHLVSLPRYFYFFELVWISSKLPYLLWLLSFDQLMLWNSPTIF
jgi:hypothetical protein